MPMCDWSSDRVLFPIFDISPSNLDFSLCFIQPSVSHDVLCVYATPWTVAHQAPLSMGFSRQEYWSGLPFLSPGVLAVQGTLKSLLPHHSSKASILRRSAFFTVQLSHPYITTGKTIALTRPKSPPTRRVPPRGTPRVPAPLPLSPFSPPDRDRNPNTC